MEALKNIDEAKKHIEARAGKKGAEKEPKKKGKERKEAKAEVTRSKRQEENGQVEVKGGNPETKRKAMVKAPEKAT